jgi:glycosyltransferase involved in cell wall biosynthesis
MKKVALVHDWLFHMRGGEKVLEAIAELFPDAEIYTLFLRKEKLSPSLQTHRFHVSILNRLPATERIYQWLLPALPGAIEQFDLRGFDLVISSSHCVAKGVRIPAGVPHVCYCHTPIRYAWYFEKEYFHHYPYFLKRTIGLLLEKIRQWDLKTSESVTQFVANSKNVAHKIRTLYGKEALVVHPPLDLDRFQPKPQKKDYFLAVSALVPYKRIDLAVDAFNELEKPLWIVGKGGEEEKLKKKARSNIRFLQWVSDSELIEIYQGARALVFPGEEDFGIAPLEAQASGTPVIAYGKGGALETVKEGQTGLFFYEQTTESLVEAVRDFEKKTFNAHAIRFHAETFSKERFQKEFQAVLKTL